MKIYVASSWRSERQPPVVERLKAEGHEVYDFKNPVKGNNGFHWSDIDRDWMGWGAKEFRDGLSHSLADEGFGFDMRTLEWCDACVLVVPATAGLSSHLDLGWAVGAKKLTIVMMLDGSEPELMYKMADHLCIGIEEVVAVLKEATPLCEYCGDQGGVSSCNVCGLIAPALAGHYRSSARMHDRAGRASLALADSVMATRLASGEPLYDVDVGPLLEEALSEIDEEITGLRAFAAASGHPLVELMDAIKRAEEIEGTLVHLSEHLMSKNAPPASEEGSS
jgi:hypothetical protein